jgi:hypothetical protein
MKAEDHYVKMQREKLKIMRPRMAAFRLHFDDFTPVVKTMGIALETWLKWESGGFDVEDIEPYKKALANMYLNYRAELDVVAPLTRTG